MLNIDESYQHVVQEEIQEYHWRKRKNIPFAASKNIKLFIGTIVLENM